MLLIEVKRIDRIYEDSFYVKAKRLHKVISELKADIEVIAFWSHESALHWTRPCGCSTVVQVGYVKKKNYRLMQCVHCNRQHKAKGK